MNVSNFAEIDLDNPPSILREEAGVHRARSILATQDSLKGYGRLVADFHREQVDIVPWPTAGWRTLVPGTGDEGGVTSGEFVFERQGQIQFATNHAVDRRYLIGWFADPADATEHAPAASTDVIYTHEANYHPDGGQVFFPADGSPFVALLALPGDDVKPDDFVAFWFDGSQGVHLDPGVWHQPVFPTRPRAVFDDKQGRVHACVSVDFVAEFKVYIEVPLARPA